MLSAKIVVKLALQLYAI